MRQNQIVGVGLGLVQCGQITWLEGFGYADLQNQTKLDPEYTLLRWASMSKQVTSITAFKLQAMGIVDFNQDIKTYIKDYPTPTQFTVPCNGKSNITYNNTVYQCNITNGFAYINLPANKQNISLNLLLSHYAGIEHYSNGASNPVPPDNLIDNPDINTGIEWALQYFIHTPLAVEPNTTFNYTTFGFDLAGATLQNAHGGSYEDIARALVFEHVYSEMPSTVPDKEWLADLRPQRAQGYITPTKLSHENDVSYKLPGGGYMSTVQDAARFIGHYRNESLLTNAQKEIAWKPFNKQQNSGYGLGFELNYQGDQLIWVGHSGAQDKARTIMRYFPKEDASLVLMSNSENINIQDLCSKIQKILFDEIQGEVFEEI